jgi:hypothetical protein
MSGLSTRFNSEPMPPLTLYLSALIFEQKHPDAVRDTWSSKLRSRSQFSETTRIYRFSSRAELIVAAPLIMRLLSPITSDNFSKLN